MRNPALRRLGLVAAAVALLVAPVAVAEEQAGALTRVEAKKVCMVNDQLFGKDQIPVAYEGRTYYGCCEMCKERLAKDAAARTGVDPATGKKVDKAKAVIVAKEDGSVLYFESEETLAKYQKDRAKGSGGRR